MVRAFDRASDEALDPTFEDLHTRLDDPRIAAGGRDIGGRVALAVYRCTKPVIRAVNGAAVGIGETQPSPAVRRTCRRFFPRITDARPQRAATTAARA
jgi:hypothetical protein